MHLQRIQVPDFRVLKDVDITFEKEFIPRVFPLGGQNGGGKSTLLQLIFVLLRCSTHDDRIPALKNILHGFKVDKNTDKRVLAKIDIWDGNKTMSLEFFCCRDSYANKLIVDRQDKEEDIICFSDISKADNLKRRVEGFEGEKDELKEISILLESLGETRGLQQNRKISDIRSRLSKLNIKVISLENMRVDSTNELHKFLVTKLRDNHTKLEVEYITLSDKAREIQKYLRSEELIYICNYEYFNEEGSILCKVENLDSEEGVSFLDDLSNKIFLAAPLTQMFIFLSPANRKLLFQEQNGGSLNETYYQYLDAAKTLLPGFFTYDYLAVDFIVESFKAARDEDFKRAIGTGEYGNSYKELLSELRTLMTNKEVSPTQDLLGVTFKMERDGEIVELNPEDLSHGELKRLSIYMWLKYRNIADAIVLMDEIEIALHPDWQYRIVSDLTEWAPSNQYILATHSYELCQALTPSHVKELEPRLIKQA